MAQMNGFFSLRFFLFKTRLFQVLKGLLKQLLVLLRFYADARAWISDWFLSSLLCGCLFSLSFVAFFVDAIVYTFVANAFRMLLVRFMGTQTYTRIKRSCCIANTKDFLLLMRWFRWNCTFQNWKYRNCTHLLVFVYALLSEIALFIEQLAKITITYRTYVCANES